MADHSALPRRSAFQRSTPLALLAGLATGLAGCSNPQSGGGTELPIQIRIFTGAEASSWRLWSIEETPSAARSAEGTPSYTFVSRGVLSDSAGILNLPTTPGMFLLESWIGNRPDNYLEIRRPMASGFRIDSSCVQSIPLDSSLHQTQVCFGLDRALAPSGGDSATRPDRLTVVRIESDRIQRLRILDDTGTDQLAPQEARLWSVSNDSGVDQTLIFRGLLTRESDGTFRIPTSRGTTRYILEGANGEHSLPDRVATRVWMGSGWTRFMDCQETVLPPLPGTISVHACPDLGWMPSGRDSTHSGADLWSAFTLQLR